MASTLTLRRRINSAQNVSKTTKAMQLVAASKLRRAQDAAFATRPYAEKLIALTRSLYFKAGHSFSHPYLEQSPAEDAVTTAPERTLLIVLSPDKGLCGSLVTNLVRTLYHTDDTVRQGKIVAVGRKAEIPAARYGDVVSAFPFGTTTPTFDQVYPLTRLIEEYYLSGEVDRVQILYTRFDSIFSQSPHVETVLPLKLTGVQSEPEEPVSRDSGYYRFEPSAADLLPQLLTHYLEMTVFQYLLESFVSEQGSRMLAMQNATDNANEIVEDLKLEYNKSRQAKITSEILDLSAGGKSHDDE